MTYNQTRIEVLNTHWGEGAGDTRTVKHLYGPGTSGRRPDAVVLQEIWPDMPRSPRFVHTRSSAAAIARSNGYTAYFPEANMDSMFAVPEGIKPLATAEHLITSLRLRIISSLGSRALRRSQGLHSMVIPMNGWGELEIVGMHRITPLAQLFTKDEAKQTPEMIKRSYPQPAENKRRLTLVVGDFNHWPGPGKHDRRLVTELGFRALVPEGTATCMVERTHPRVAQVLGWLGVGNPQLDAAYVRAPEGIELVDASKVDLSQLTDKQVAYRLDLHDLKPDHLGLGITLFTAGQQ